MNRLLGYAPTLLLLLSTVSCGGSVTAPDEPCKNLYAQLAATDRMCLGTYAETAPEANVVASCIGLATAEGSLVEAADIDACAASIAEAGCGPGGRAATCVGYGHDLLFPDHQKKGSAAAGAACIADLQCESAYCSANGDACGVCLAPRALGEPCGGGHDVCVTPEAACNDAVCSFGGSKEGEACVRYGGGHGGCQAPLFCNATAANGFEGTCTPRGGPGAPCNPDALDCLDGLICDAEVCAAPPADGAACLPGGACDDGSMCVDGICRARRFGVGENEACDPDSCRPDLDCMDHVCKSFPIASEGEACGPQNGGETVQCAHRFQCDIVSDVAVCVGPPEAGEACSEVSLCAANATCVGFHANGVDDFGKCTARGDSGEPCPCGDDLACVGDKCVPFGAVVCQ